MTVPPDPLLQPGSGGAEPDFEAELPGREQPDWLWPVLVVTFASLIAWLAIFGPAPDDSIADSTAVVDSDVSGSADADASATSDVTSDVTSGGTSDVPASAGPGDPDSGTDIGVADPDGESGDVEIGAGVVDPIGDASQAESASGAAAVAADLDLPRAGFVRLDGIDHPIMHSCVSVAPLAPASTTDLVSTHLVAAVDGVDPVVPIVERWFTADGESGVRVDRLGNDVADLADPADLAGLGGVRAAVVTDGPGGSFAGQIELTDGTLVELAVNPPAEGDDRLTCDDAVVTNEPAQFAFPYTRPVIAVCRTGDPVADGGVVAVLAEGARMSAVANTDGSHTLRLVAVPTPLTEGIDLIDEAGELFVDGARLGYSGLVTDGAVSLDLTFDVETDGAAGCASWGL